MTSCAALSSLAGMTADPTPVSPAMVRRAPATRHRDGQAATAPAAGGPAPDEPRRIALIVDDEPMVATLTARALASVGWHTVMADGPEAAVAIARDLAPDLLVTDFSMPGMSGFDLASHLRTARASLPVILVSGSPEAAALTLAQPFAFLAKPFSLAGLFGTIGRLVPADEGG